MMKIQELSIIFVIIMLPISIILSAYTQFQIQTLNTQILYDTKLTSSTFDAIKAFQLNTANSSLDDISNSKIRDIEASVKTFKNTMISTFRLNGYTEDDLNNFIPALVYTMYDGFYIYSPYENVNYMEDDAGNPIEGNGELMYGLKPYISYSCRYKKGTTDVVITYTLDNYITVQGNIGAQYINESGYLIDNVTEIGNSVYYNGVGIDDKEDLREYVPGEDGVIRKYRYVKYNGTKYYYDANNIDDRNDANGKVFYYSNGSYTEYGKNTEENRRFLNLYLQGTQGTAEVEHQGFTGTTTVIYPYINSGGRTYYYDENSYSFFWNENGRKYQYRGNKSYNNMVNAIINNNSAKRYYQNAKTFTEYIEKELKDLDICDAIDPITQQPIWGHDNRSIFQGSSSAGAVNIENKLSNFNQHRLQVIRYIIEKNLSLAIENYNNYTSAQDIIFQMPQLKEEEWDLVMNNISLISFVQGLDIGGKIYNGYAIVNNTESKEVVQEDRIYILGEDNFYHKIGDVYLENLSSVKERSLDGYNLPAGRLNLDFKKQKMIKQDNNIIYYFPLKYDGTNSYKGSYDSIITQNNVTPYVDIYKYIYEQPNNNLKKAFYMALGREREATYKSTTTNIQ